MNWKILVYENLKYQCNSKDTILKWFGNTLRIQNTHKNYFSLVEFSPETIDNIKNCNNSDINSTIILVCSYLLTEHEFLHDSCGSFIQIPNILFRNSAH